MKFFKRKNIETAEETTPVKRLGSRRVARWIEKFKVASRNKKILIVLLFSLPSILVMFAITAEITSRPSFCRTCHYMEPFYQSWKSSSHGDIACTKCHFPPGIAGTIRGKIEGLVQVVNYVTSSYLRRKPWAEIDDASCLQGGCHEQRLLKGKVNFKNVVFDHKHHIGEMKRGKNLRCTSCHSQIVQGDHMVVTETTCFLCHFKKGGETELLMSKKMSKCETCHHWENVPKMDMAKFRFDHSDVVKNKIRCTQCHQNTVIGDGFVPKENCYSCHFDNERLSKFKNTKLLHNVHISQNKIECIQCHLQIQHKVQKLSADEELECTTCHTSEHSEQLMLFAGKSIHGIKGIPNPMYEAGLTCASCHLFHKEMFGEASVNIANQKACETCHGKGYSNLLGLWQESSGKKIVEFQKALREITGKLNSTGKSRNKEIKSYLDKASENVDFITQGIPIHNIQYSELIINTSYEYLGKALALAKMDYKLPKVSRTTATPGQCYNCHTGVEEITRPFGNSQFSHRTHVVNNSIDCRKCHSNARKHGELVINKNTCNSCHHQKATMDNCVNCHKNSVEIYSGKFQNEDIPGFMFEGGVACADCHLVDKQIVKPGENNCVSCHDDSYKETFREWKTEVQKLYKEIELKMNKTRTSKQFIYSFKFAKLEKQLQDIKQGSASGIHNYNLTLKLLNELKKELNGVM